MAVSVADADRKDKEVAKPVTYTQAPLNAGPFSLIACCNARRYRLWSSCSTCGSLSVQVNVTPAPRIATRPVRRHQGAAVPVRMQRTTVFGARYYPISVAEPRIARATTEESRRDLQRFTLRYSDGLLAAVRAVRQNLQVRIIRTQNVLVLARNRSWSNFGCRLAGMTLPLAVLALSLSGCATGSGAVTGSAARDWQQTDLYFAIGRPGDGAAGETVWRRFIAAEVIPRFPDGFTIVPAVGTWRADASGSAPELDSRVLVILHPPSREADERIEAIRRAWRANTDAESVLRSDHAARVSF